MGHPSFLLLCFTRIGVYGDRSLDQEGPNES